MPLGQAAGDARGRRALPGWDDDAHAVVAAAPHGTAAGVHHEADQEPAEGREQLDCWPEAGPRRRGNQDDDTDTSEEGDSHAVTTVHPNRERLNQEKTTRVKTEQQK